VQGLNWVSNTQKDYGMFLVFGFLRTEGSVQGQGLGPLRTKRQLQLLHVHLLTQ